MNRHILHITLITLQIGTAAHTATAQDTTKKWAPAGAEWYYNYSDGFFQTGYTHIKYIGDSLVGGKMCKMLEKKIYWYDQIIMKHDSSSIGLEFTYEDSNKVYYYRFNNFFTLYDFNADTGTRWIIAGQKLATCDTIGEVKTDSVSIAIINSDTLKQIYTSPYDSSHWQFLEKIIEKIGPTVYMFPTININCGVAVDGWEGWTLRCYRDSAFGLYQTGVVSSCDFITSVSEINNSNVNLFVYPNPIRDILTVNLPDGQFFNEFKIVDVLGNIVFEKNITSSHYNVNMTDYPNGLYIVRIKYNNENIKYDKVLKIENYE